jgi:hypothetical protein
VIYLDLKKIIPVILVSAVFGCTFLPQMTTTTSGNGVYIESFSSDYTSVYPDDSFTVALNFRNNGGKEATLLFATLEAVSSLAVPTPTQTSSSLQMDDYDSFEWTLTVPSNAIDGERYNPKALFCYAYETGAYTDLFLTERTFSGTIPALQDYYTRGPVSLTFEKDTPIRGNRTSSSLKVIASLNAPGFLGNDITSVSSYGTRDYLESLVLTIPTVNGLIGINTGQTNDFTCATSVDTITCNATGTNVLRLVDDRADARLYMTIDNSGEGASYQYTVRVYATAKYRHCVETDTLFPLNVVVQGY